jgi:hypothetical protein
VTSLRLTHVGGPTLLIEVGPWRLLTDPTLDPPGRRYRLGWGTGSTKLAGPAIDAAAVQPIDAILLTHDHHDDNLDDAGRELLPSAEVVVTTSSLGDSEPVRVGSIRGSPRFSRRPDGPRWRNRRTRNSRGWQIDGFLALAEAEKRYPSLKTAWIEFLRERPEPIIDRVE